MRNKYLVVIHSIFFSLIFLVLPAKPQSALDFYDLGNELANQGEYRFALEAFEASFELDSSNAKTAFNLALSNYFLNNLNDAIKYLTRAIEIDKGYTYAYQNRAALYELVGKYSEAIEDLDVVIEDEPNVAINYYNRGRYKRFLEEYSEALEDYNILVELAPEFIAGYRNRGAILSILGNYEKALVDYNEVLELYEIGITDTEEDENNISGDYFNRALCKARMKDLDGACADVKIASSLGYDVSQLKPLVCN